VTSLDGSATFTIIVAVHGADDVPDANPDPFAPIAVIGLSGHGAAAGEYYL
jgi:hypothetical protein